jgi:Nucleoside 2-deoxyribosyltransferase like
MSVPKEVVKAIDFLVGTIGIEATKDTEYLATYETQTVQEKNAEMQENINIVLDFVRNSYEANSLFYSLIEDLKKKKSKKVFLGGTCGNSTWREELIPQLKINYFNPVVENWTPECQEEELRQREECDYCLYVITSQMSGVYSIAEVVDDSNKRPNRTLFCFIEDGFEDHQIKSLAQASKMVKENGAKTFSNLKDVANYLNEN